MQMHRYLITIILLTLAFINCRNKKDFTGSWKPFEVKVWDNYHADSLLINLISKQFHFNHDDPEILALMTPSYKDSLLKLLFSSYLTLENNGDFVMEDHAIFSQAFSDTAWHKVRYGKWKMEMDNSILTLTQQNGLTKCYKIIGFLDNTLDIGELFECKERPITEIRLNR